MSKKETIKQLVKKAGKRKALVQSDLVVFAPLKTPAYYEL